MNPNVRKLEAAIRKLERRAERVGARWSEYFAIEAQIAVLQAAVWEIQRETFRYYSVQTMEHTAIVLLADKILAGDPVGMGSGR